MQVCLCQAPGDEHMLWPLPVCRVSSMQSLTVGFVVQGWRKSMEDAHIATTQLVNTKAPCSAMFGVFDGHGGRWIACLCCSLSSLEHSAGLTRRALLQRGCQILSEVHGGRDPQAAALQRGARERLPHRGISQDGPHAGGPALL